MNPEIDIPLSAAERRAVTTLKRLSNRWPKSLWLYSAGGTLCVMRKGLDGQRVTLNERGGGFDPDCVVATVHIENEGGDW